MTANRASAALAGFVAGLLRERAGEERNGGDEMSGDSKVSRRVVKVVRRAHAVQARRRIEVAPEPEPMFDDEGRLRYQPLPPEAFEYAYLPLDGDPGEGEGFA